MVAVPSASNGRVRLTKSSTSSHASPPPADRILSHLEQIVVISAPVSGVPSSSKKVKKTGAGRGLSETT